MPRLDRLPQINRNTLLTFPAQVNNAVLGTVYPNTQLFDLPFVFRDNTHMRHVVRGPIGQQIYAEYADKTGMALLMAGLADGPRSVWNRTRSVRSPADPTIRNVASSATSAAAVSDGCTM